MDQITVLGGWLPDRLWWEILNFTLFGLSVIALIFVVKSKRTVTDKIVDALIIYFFSPIGALYYFGKLLYLSFRQKKELPASVE